MGSRRRSVRSASSDSFSSSIFEAFPSFEDISDIRGADEPLDEDLSKSLSDRSQVGEESDTEDVIRFTDFERFALVGVLNIIIDKLILIGADKPKVIPQVNFHPPKVRYHDKIRKRLYDHATNTLISDGEGPRMICRFQKLRTLLEHILKLTRDEINERSTCDALTGFIVLEDKRVREEILIKNTYDQYTQIIKNLKSAAKENATKTKIALEEQEKLSLKLQGSLQEDMFRYGTMLAYCKHWEQARCEQNTIRCTELEDDLNDELQKLKNQYSEEMRVHRDVMVFLKLSLKKLEKDINKWSKKYEVDIENKDTEILGVKQKREETRTKIQDLLLTWDKRQRRIQKFSREKAERERIAEEEKRKRLAATRIQSWWRGTMVRWELGRFAPDKGKKKKGKGKGGARGRR